MAIAYDAVANSGVQSISSSYSFNHTVGAGSDRYLIVGVAFTTTENSVSGITYNGTAMSLLKAERSASRAVELWGLANPDTGTNSVAVTLSGASTTVSGAISFTGVKQTSSTEGSASANGTGTSDISVGVTTVADNDWVVDCASTNDTAVTVGGGQTSRVNVSDMMFGSAVMSHEGPQTPAGSVTMSWTNVGSLLAWTTAAVALIPAPTSVDHTVAAGGGNWGTASTWVEGTVPTANDNCFAGASSGNFTIDTGAVGRSLDCTGFTGTLTHNSGVTLTLGDATAGTGNVALKLVSGMTYTKGHATSSAISFVSTSATQQTIDCGGKTLGDVTINGAGGSYVLSASLQTAGVFTLTAGTFNDGNWPVYLVSFSSSNSNTRALTMANSWIVSGSSGTLWDCSTSTNLTVNASGGGSVLFTDTGASDKAFDGGGKSWYTFTISAGGAGAVVLKNSDTFAGVITVGGPKTLKITKTKTVTVENLILGGSAGNVVTIDTEDGAGTATISCPNTVEADYLSVTRSVAAGNVPFYAGTHSTDGGTNTNWSFTAAPTGVAIMPPPFRHKQRQHLLGR